MKKEKKIFLQLKTSEILANDLGNLCQLRRIQLNAEWKHRIGLASKGRKMPPRTAEHLRKISMANKGHVSWIKGKKQTQEHIRNRLNSRIQNGTDPKNTAPKGSDHYLWIEDRSKIKRYWEERNNPEYKQWRIKVFRRDNFICKIKNYLCSGKITAHHILRWSLYPELRYEVNNGITLCQHHHPRKINDEIRLSTQFRNLIVRV